MCETLAELNRRGIKNAVLTNKPNAVACALIDRFFGDAMELCVGQMPETISKPDPHSMDPVLERLGIPREQILYVGDTDVDMQTARNTQTAAAAAAWGYQPLGNAAALPSGIHRPQTETAAHDFLGGIHHVFGNEKRNHRSRYPARPL